MRARSFICLLLPGALASCTQFPALDRATDPAALAAPYPALLPIEELPAPAAAPAVDPAAELAAEAAALRARVASMPTTAP